MHVGISWRAFLHFLILELLLVGLLSLIGQVPWWVWIVASAVLYLALWIYDHRARFLDWARTWVPAPTVPRSELDAVKLQLARSNKLLADAKRAPLSASPPTAPVLLPTDVAGLVARALMLHQGIKNLKLAQKSIARDAETFKERIKAEPASRNQPKTSSMDGLGPTRVSWNEAISRSENFICAALPGYEIDLRTQVEPSNVERTELPGKDIEDEKARLLFQNRHFYAYNSVLAQIAKALKLIESQQASVLERINHLPEAKMFEDDA